MRGKREVIETERISIDGRKVWKQGGRKCAHDRTIFFHRLHETDDDDESNF